MGLKQEILRVLDGKPMPKSGIAKVLGIILSSPTTIEEDRLSSALGEMQCPPQSQNKRDPKILPDVGVAFNKKADGSDKYVYYLYDQAEELEKAGKLSAPGGVDSITSASVDDL
jgi:hypothetical protein